MAHFDKARSGPEKWLMQLGTLSGNPVAAAAGLKTMEILRRCVLPTRLISLLLLSDPPGDQRERDMEPLFSFLSFDNVVYKFLR
jgi:hypothetical protein